MAQPGPLGGGVKVPTGQPTPKEWTLVGVFWALGITSMITTRKRSLFTTVSKISALDTIGYDQNDSCVCVCSVAQSCLTLCNPVDCTPLGSTAHGISRQEYWSDLPFPSPGDPPDPGIEPLSPASPALAGGFFTIQPPGRPR